MTEAAPSRKPIEIVGVIGLDGIGRPIARRFAALAENGRLRKVAAYDTDASVLTGAPAALDGTEVVVCKSIAHLVDMADLVLLCLPGSAEVAKIARSHEGLLDCVRQGQIIVDHGWSTLDLTQQLATAFAARGAAFIDAPIRRFDGVEGAIDEGRLGFAIGGEPASVDAVLPLLKLIADEITPVGASGSAQVVRQMVDLVALQTFTALAEALLTARALGIEGGLLLEALAKASSQGDDLARHGLADMVGRGDGTTATRPSIADAGRRLDDAIRVAESKNIELSGARNTLRLLEEAMKNGLGDEALGGLFKAVELERGQQDGQRKAR